MVTISKIKKIFSLELIIEGKDIKEVNAICEKVSNSLNPLCVQISHEIITQGAQSEKEPSKYKYYCAINCIVEIKELNEEIINDTKFKELIKSV